MATIALYFQGEKIADRVIDKARLTIGRNSENDIVLADSKVSGQHARLSFEKNQYIIEDLMSTNGTLYRGEKVLRHLCRNGDEIQIGEYVLRFSGLEKDSPSAASSRLRSSVAESLRQPVEEHTMYLETTGSFQSEEKKASSKVIVLMIVLAVIGIVAALAAIVYFS